MQDFSFLQKMAKVYLFYYPDGFSVYIATIIAYLLIILSQKIPATGKAVLILCHCYSSSSGRDDAVQ